MRQLGLDSLPLWTIGMKYNVSWLPITQGEMLWDVFDACSVVA
jgi:hypothetical protein